MTPLVPRVWFRAPQHPARLVVSVLALAAVLFFVLASTNTGGFLPGIAEAERDGSTAVITFESGDRFFWLPYTPQGTIHASDLLAELPGEQSITKRSSYTSKERLGFDEGGQGEDFLIETDFLYEVGGVLTSAVFTYEATTTVGKGFMDDIKQHSNSYIRRVWSQVKAMPGIVIHDLAEIGQDFRNLFHKPGPETAPATAAARGVFEQWPLFAGIIAIAIIGPFLGFGPGLIGGASGLILLTGGSWPFYVMSGLSIIMGLFLDPNLPFSGLIGRSAEGGAGLVGQFKHWNPNVFSGFVIYVIGAVAGFVAAAFGWPNIVAITMIVSGAAALFVMSGKAFTRVHEQDGYSWEEEVRLERLGPSVGGSVGDGLRSPAVWMSLLAVANMAWLFHLGYSGIAWAFLIFALAMSGMVAYRLTMKSKQARKARRAALDGLGSGWAALGTMAKLFVYVAVFFVWLAAAEFSKGDWIAGSGNVLAAILITLGVVFTKSYAYIKATREKEAQDA